MAAGPGLARKYSHVQEELREARLRCHAQLRDVRAQSESLQRSSTPSDEDEESLEVLSRLVAGTKLSTSATGPVESAAGSSSPSVSADTSELDGSIVAATATPTGASDSFLPFV